jgi:hypothetical protein
MAIYRSGGDAADERIRAASAAVAERERLRRLRAALYTDVQLARARVDELAAALTAEQRDVEHFRGGVWAFVYGVFRDREARLAEEEREATEAAARHEEAVASRDELERQLGELDDRLVSLDGAEVEAKAAREAKQAALLAGDTPTAAGLRATLEELGRADDERRQLEEAAAVGDDLARGFAKLGELLATARSRARSDRWSEDAGTSWWTERAIQDSRGLLGLIDGRMAVFRRELADVAMTFEAPGVELGEARFGGWIEHLFSNVTEDAIDAAQLETAQTARALDAVLAVLRERASGVERRRTALANARDDHIDPA